MSSLTSKSRTDVWLRPEGIDRFAGDLSEREKKLVWATQCVPAPDLFNAAVGGTAWKSKPSWYIVAKNDRTVHPDMERFVAERMGATTTEVGSSHVPNALPPRRGDRCNPCRCKCSSSNHGGSVKGRGNRIPGHSNSGHCSVRL